MFYFTCDRSFTTVARTTFRVRRTSAPLRQLIGVSAEVNIRKGDISFSAQLKAGHHRFAIFAPGNGSHALRTLFIFLGFILLSKIFYFKTDRHETLLTDRRQYSPQSHRVGIFKLSPN